jgi:glycosyltransferase involved in cell wall biosynthesis
MEVHGHGSEMSVHPLVLFAPEADTFDLDNSVPMARPLHVLHTFSNNSSVPYLSWFAERASQEGSIRYSFIIMFPERPAMIDEMEARGFACIWIPYDDRHRKRGILRAFPLLWKHIRRLKPDIVHCNLFDDSLPGLLAAWLAGIRVRVITRQDTGFHWNHAPRWVFLDRWNTRSATHIIAISGECRQFLIEQEGAPAEKVHLVHNGIPPEQFTRKDDALVALLGQRFGLKGHAPIIGTVARFIEWKGYRHIVDAASLVVEKHPNARFLFCGTGPQERTVRSWVKEAGLADHVIFTGWIDRSHMASFYGLLDVYLHAAQMEPFGLVYAEAMMNNVPIVSTSTGAARDAIVDGRNGILVKERSGLALAAGVERCLAAGGIELGAAGRETAMRMFPFDVMWKGTIELYRKAVS